MLLFVIILFAAALVSNEYQHGVFQISRTSKLGCCGFAAKKAVILIAVTIGLSIISQLLQLFCCGISYGMTSVNAPVQSIHAFAESEKQFTILQAWIFILLLRSIAYMVFGMLLFGIAAVCTNPAKCLSIGLGIVFVPLYLLTGT